jgi:sugar lactone lactonase YvrE
MPNRFAVFFMCLLLGGGVLARPSSSDGAEQAGERRAGEGQSPKNADQGDILLAGLVLTPGQGGSKVGLTEDLVPLPGALVAIEGTEYATTTDRRGLFIFTEAPEGEVTVVITHQGYQTLRRKATVEKGVEEAPTLRVEMLPLGVTRDGGVLSGPGTLYACFVPRTQTESGDDGDFTNLLAVLALGLDPLRLSQPREVLDVEPATLDAGLSNDAGRCVMIRPPAAPAATSFMDMGSYPIWPCFDKSGRYLYVSTVYQHRIEVFDVANKNDMVAWVPLQGPRAFVTSLTCSADGRYVFATQMGARMGVLAVDTASQIATAFLDLPDATMIPNALALSPDGSRLYVALSSAVNAGAPGQLLALDPSSGAVLSTVPVGSTPTDLLITPDGKTAVTVNLGNGNLSVIDLEQGAVIRTLQAEVSPSKAILTDDGRLFVTNRGSGTVSMLALADGRLLGRLKVGRGPMDIVLGKDGSQAYVSNYQDGTISVLDVARGAVLTTTPAMPRANPVGLAIRP